MISQLTAKNILRHQQVYKKKGNSRKKQILAVIWTIKKENTLFNLALTLFSS